MCQDVMFLLACIAASPSIVATIGIVHLQISAEKLVLISRRVARIHVSVSDMKDSDGFLTPLTILVQFLCVTVGCRLDKKSHVKIYRRKSKTKH